MAETLAAYEARIDAESAEGDRYLLWCEENDLDPDEDHWDSFRVEELDHLGAHLASVAEDRATTEVDIGVGIGW